MVCMRPADPVLEKGSLGEQLPRKTLSVGYLGTPIILNEQNKVSLKEEDRNFWMNAHVHAEE